MRPRIRLPVTRPRTRLRSMPLLLATTVLLGLSPDSLAAQNARLGVRIDFDQVDAEVADGVLVVGVPEDSPAGRAGLREGDVIMSLDGRSVREPLLAEEEAALDDDGSRAVQRLMVFVDEHEPGDSVEVVYSRNGEREESVVELGSRRDRGRFSVLGRIPGLRGRFWRSLPDGQDLPYVPGWSDSPDGPDFRFPDDVVPGGLAEEIGFRIRDDGLWRWSDDCADVNGAFALYTGRCVAGLDVRALNPELGAYFGTDSGVLVLNVVEDSPLGLQPGDVILAVGERAVTDPRDLRRILRSYEEGEDVSFRVRRNGQEETVRGTTP